MKKCPVCKTECTANDKMCPECGFPDPTIEFVSYADAEEWRDKTLEPCRSVWRKNQDNNSSAKYAALRIIYNAALSGHFSTAISVKNGQQYIIDGFRALRYPLSFTLVEKIVSHPDSDRLCSQADNTINSTEAHGIAIELPSVHHLRKLHQEHKDAFDFGKDKPLVRISYLIDLLEALPDAKAMCIPHATTSVLCLYSQYGEGMLLPVNKSTYYRNGSES